MFKTVDRYIFKELFDPFLFGLLSFTLILSASMVLFELVRAVILQGMSLVVALQLFLYRLPAVMVYIFPMATLLAALLGFGRLSKDSEIIAFRAAGVSLYRMLVPVLVFGLMISIVTFFFYEVVVPQSNRAAKNLLLETSTKKAPKIEENVFVPEMKDGTLRRIFYFKKVKGNVMEGVVVGEFSDGRLSQLINARTAEWDNSKRIWRFKKGVIYILSEEGEYKHLIKFDRQDIAIKFTPADFHVGDRHPDDMNIDELRQFIALKEKMGVKVTDFKIQLNMKIAIPFASLVFALLGAPLGLSPRRSTSSVGLGLSIIVVFIYYVLMFASMSFGLLNVVPPWVAAWTPNFICGGIGYYILSKAAQS